MEQRHGHAAWTWTRSMDRDVLTIPFYATCPCCMFVQSACPSSCPCCMSVHAANPCPCCMSISMPMLHSQVRAAWTRTSSRDMGMQQWTWACSTDVGMQHGQGHAAWILTCSMDVGIQHCQGNAAWIRICSMDMDMQHKHGHAAWQGHWYGQDMDIDFYWTGTDSGQLYFPKVCGRVRRT